MRMRNGRSRPDIGNSKLRDHKGENQKVVKRVCGIIKIDGSASIDKLWHSRESVLEFDQKVNERVRKGLSINKPPIARRKTRTLDCPIPSEM